MVVFFVVGGGESVPGIPGACATRNFAYLVKGPFRRHKKLNTSYDTNVFSQKLITKWVFTEWGNDLSPAWRQTITWTKIEVLSIKTFRTNFYVKKILIKWQKVRSSAGCEPFSSDLDVSIIGAAPVCILTIRPWGNLTDRYDMYFVIEKLISWHDIDRYNMYFVIEKLMMINVF